MRDHHGLLRGFKTGQASRQCTAPRGLRRQKSPVLFDHFCGIIVSQDTILKKHLTNAHSQL